MEHPAAGREDAGREREADRSCSVAARSSAWARPGSRAAGGS